MIFAAFLRQSLTRAFAAPPRTLLNSSQRPGKTAPQPRVSTRHPLSRVFQPLGLLCAVSGTLTLPGRVVHAQQPYQIADGRFYITDGTGLFGILDLQTNTFQQIGGTLPVLLDNLGYAPDGTLYALGGSDINNQHVYRIDPTTATLTDLGNTAHSAYGAAVGPDGLIYSIDPNTNELFKVNPRTLAVTLIGVVTVRNGQQNGTPYGGAFLGYDGLLAFAPNGTLYVGEDRTGFGGGSTTLESVDLTTAQTQPLALGALGFNAYTAGTFFRNELYIFDGFQTKVVDPATGRPIAERSNPFSLPYGDSGYIFGIVPIPAAVPEPGAYALCVGLGVSAAGFLSRRRQQAHRAA